MTAEQFMEVSRRPLVHDFVWKCARRHGKRIELQEEFIQEAWLAISCAPGDWKDTAYMRLAFKAIHSSYWQNHKEMLLLFGKRPARSTKSPRNERFIGSERDEASQSANWRN
jgi:hypothetical protein